MRISCHYILVQIIIIMIIMNEISTIQCFVQKFTSHSTSRCYSRPIVRTRGIRNQHHSQSAFRIGTTIPTGNSITKVAITTNIHKNNIFTHRSTFVGRSLQLRMSSSSSGTSPPSAEIVHVNRNQMEEIVEDYESGGREESQYCIIDVRTEDEVRNTGKISEHTYTLPIQVMMQYNVMEMDDATFEEVCQFPKPTPDETIVFTCAAGMRSVMACQIAAKAGYSKLINYAGGANEWFTPSSF